MTRDTWHVARATHLIAFLLPALVAFYLGWVAHARALVDLDTVAAMGNAWRVFHWQDAANMALIGFDQPPLMALLFVPFAAFTPQSLVSGVAAPILGAIFLGLSVLIIWRLSRSLGLPAWVALILGAIFTLHPLVLSYAMLGSRGMVLTFVLLGLAASLVSWQREQRVRDVVTGSFFAAAAILLAYETVALVLAAATYLAVTCRGEKKKTPAKAEGLLVAFLLPAAYVAFVWIAANWAIMGDPWHFWQPPPPSECILIPRIAWLTDALHVWLVVNPLLLGLVYYGLRRGRSVVLGAPAAWLLVASLLSAMLFSTFRVHSRSWLWVQFLPIASAAAGMGIVLLAAFAAQLLPAIRSREERATLPRLVSPGLLLITLGSLALGVHLMTSDPHLPLDVRTPWKGYPAFARDVHAEWEVAQRLKSEWDAGRPHLLYGLFAYVVALRAEAKANVAVLGPKQRDTVLRNLYLQPGSMIACQTAYEGFPAFLRGLRPDLVPRARYRVGWWAVFQCASPPLAQPPRGQPSSSDAIIPPGAPHAHPRH